MDQNNQPIQPVPPMSSPVPPVTPPMQAPPQTPPPQAPSPFVAPKSEKKVGPIVATLIIVLIIIIAALYLFASRINQTEAPAETARALQSAQAVQTSDPSVDDIDTLEAELDAAIEGLDKENF